MVQGLGTDHLGWMLQVPEFSKHYRVITFDNRDVGQSKQADGPYEVADMARDALALADHLELDTSTCSACRWAARSRRRSP